MTRFRKIKYKDINILYQGSYELDFIKFCIDNNISIKKGPSINYIDNNKKRVYHSNFIIDKYNLICEIKSKYTYNCDLVENILKKEYSIKSGYNFIFIIDKDYNELKKFINNDNI